MTDGLNLDALREAAVANARADSDWDAVLALLQRVKAAEKELRWMRDADSLAAERASKAEREVERLRTTQVVLPFDPDGEALGWREMAIAHANRATELEAEVERLRAINDSLEHAVKNTEELLRQKDVKIGELRSLVDTERDIGDDIDKLREASV